METKIPDFFTLLHHSDAELNAIESLSIDGKVLEKQEDIQQEAVNFFKKGFKEEYLNRPTFNSLDFRKLTDEESLLLTAPFSKEEIDEAVSSCDSEKAPGPDGFNFMFIKSAWEVIKNDIYETISEFWHSSRLPQGSNTAFIALIPKIGAPSSFKDYRPISMVGRIYKIVSKLPARRLQKVIHKLISPSQSAFIKGRQILDGALIASELIDSCRKAKTKAVVLKLDFHKAFDCVSWSYLDWVMSQMGFPVVWRKWIRSCVMTASASVLVNGSPTRPFKLQKGLRQGDPLSPFLFDLVVEPLSLLIHKALSLKKWEGIGFSNEGLKITHLQYADDAILFCPPKIDYLMNIKMTLIIFHLVSGLQVNFHKSSILGLNLEQ